MNRLGVSCMILGRGRVGRGALAAGSRRAGPGRGPIEGLERRVPLAVDIVLPSLTEGMPVTATVARFEAADVLLPPARATIDWGDGDTTTGTIVERPGSMGAPSTFEVVGSNTYPVQGMYPVTVTVTGAGGSTATGREAVEVVNAPLTASPSTVAATAGEPFRGVVASFRDAYVGLTADDYAATITWGDGDVTVGTIRADGRGGFAVEGTNTYPTPGSFTAAVRIIRRVDGQEATASSTAVVVGAAVAPGPSVDGGLDPLDDTGIPGDGKTRTNRPAFLGTAEPFAVVRLFGRRPDQLAPVALGETVAGAGGLWRLTVGPLADGEYAITAEVTPATGFPRPPASLGRTPLLVIDTIGPRVTSLARGPRRGEVVVVFRDDRSGMDATTMDNDGNYAVLGPHPVRFIPPGVRVLSSPTPVPSDPRAASVTIGSRFLRGSSTLRILAGGVADAAGNALDGESRGRFPSGDGLPGGTFFARLAPGRTIRGRIGRNR